MLAGTLILIQEFLEVFHRGYLFLGQKTGPFIYFLYIAFSLIV